MIASSPSGENPTIRLPLKEIKEGVPFTLIFFIKAIESCIF